MSIAFEENKKNHASNTIYMLTTMIVFQDDM